MNRLTGQSRYLPEIYEINGCRILFPKDPKAGGSWIAVNENGHAGVILNGAMKAHISEPPTGKAGDLILLDLIAHSSSPAAFEEADFNGIEPFTVILFENENLYSGKWDGRMKWLESLNAHKPQIWSSVTLYDRGSAGREKWFKPGWMNMTIPAPWI